MTGKLPDIVVEAGFAPTDPATAPGNLILDDATYGLLGTGTLGDSTTWTDIGAYVRSLTVTRTGSRQQGPMVVFQGGTATVRLDNSDGRFDPENLSGPYVAAGVTQVRPMIPVRIRAIWAGTTYYLFSGYAKSWIPPARNFGPVYAETSLACADGMRVLTGVKLAALASAVGAGELSGARMTRILNAAGWYSSARRESVLDGGQSKMQATSYGSSALTLLQLAADSEAGQIYIDGRGRFVFRGRHAPMSDTRSNTVQGVFGDLPGTAHSAGTELEMNVAARPDDDTAMANDIQATIAGSPNMQEASDAASIARFVFPRTYPRSDLILTTDSEALDWARYLLYIAKDDESRFDSLSINPGVDASALFPQVLGRELGDRIQVWRRPPNVAAISKDCFIRGITHNWDGGQWWETTWDLSSATRYSSFLTLDNSALGALGSNALAW